MRPRGQRFASIAIALALSLMVGAACSLSPADFAPPSLSEGAVTDPTSGLLTPSLSTVPMFFVQNRGQVGTVVDYYLQSADTSVGFSDQGVQMTLMENHTPAWDLRLVFPGARSVSPEPQAPTKSGCQLLSRWATGPQHLLPNRLQRPLGGDRPRFPHLGKPA